MDPKAAKTEHRRLLLLKLKREFQYSGADRDRWREACVKLALVLGYDIEENHRKLLDHYASLRARNRRRSLVLGFRGLGKSTVGTITVAIKLALEDPNIRILFVSATDSSAREFLKEARVHLQTNDDLIEMFGLFFATDGRGNGITGKYRDGYATIAQKTQLWIREPTFLSLGIGGQMASRHFDVVFADDLVVLRNSRTQIERRNIRDWHDSTLLGSLMPGAWIFYLGTRYYPNELNDDLEHGRVGEITGVLADATLRLPMVENYDDEREDWIPTSPERFPREACIAARIEMGAYHFMAQMQQDTRSGEGIIFNYSDFMWYEADERPALNDLQVWQGYDLVAKKTDTGAFFAGVTVGVYTADSGEVRIYVLDLVRERCGMARQRELIYRHTAHWMPIKAGVEAVAMQAGFAEEAADNTLLPVEPVELTGKMEGDKVARAMRVAPKIENHQVYFPKEGTPAGDRVEYLVQEMTQFPDGDFKDAVDAFVMAVTLAIYGTPGPSMPLEEGATRSDDDGLLADYD